ncbi:MAG: hypothetical protein ABI835_01640, partial [Chloroflexota bacterium]
IQSQASAGVFAVLRLFRYCAVCLVVFAGLLGLLHSQPRDDSDLRAFVTFPERCPSACFLGIRPGFTPIANAIRSLERNAMIADLNNGISQRSGTGEVSWRWSETASALINSAYPGRLRASDGIVSAIMIEMRAPAGTLQLALDAVPARMDSAGWQVNLRAACPRSLYQYWFAPARLEITTHANLEQRLACVP